MNNARLLKAKSIIERSFIRGDLVHSNDEGEVGYCALGAIAKAHEDDADFELDNNIRYTLIPVEDIVVLACEIDPMGIDRFIQELNEGNGYPQDIYVIIHEYNDSSDRDEVVEKFKAACKNYEKHKAKIVEFWKACYTHKHLNNFDSESYPSFASEEKLAKTAGIELEA